MLALLVPIVSACGDDDGQPPVETLIPLQIGNSWTYEVYAVNGEDREYVGDQVVTIIGGTFINDVFYFATEDENLWFSQNASGSSVADVTDGIVEEFLLRWPADAGDSYQTQAGNVAYVVSVRREQMTVTAGSWNAYVYEFEPESSTTAPEYEFAAFPDVGLIKVEVKGDNRELELKSSSIQ
jgi:hypothetical protein